MIKCQGRELLVSIYNGDIIDGNRIIYDYSTRKEFIIVLGLLFNNVNDIREISEEEYRKLEQERYDNFYNIY
jgi:hypothetical protein